MTGSFAEMDPVRCPHYAQFAYHLPRWQFDIIYWILFGFNLVILFVACWAYMGCLNVVETFPAGSPERRRRLARCVIFCIGCVAVSTVTVVMEVYALLALQFCDGEDLMSLYWSTWTMIQVGSLIAVIGIILALCHTLREKRHPPWALALGTPVLVVAGSFHFFHECVKNWLANWRRKDEVIEGQAPESLSRSATLEAEPSSEAPIVGAQIVGFTIDGGPIIHFTEGVPSFLPDRAEVMGRCQNDKPIIFFQRDAVRLSYSKETGCSPSDTDKRDIARATRMPARRSNGSSDHHHDTASHG